MIPNPHHTAMAVAILAALLMLPIGLGKCAVEWIVKQEERQ